MTNENVACLNSLYDFDRANVLTVLGSGDQYFTSLLYGANEVDVMDINYTAWLYFRFKFKALKVLNYEEFISLFVERNYNNISIYNKLYSMLSYEELNYYIYLINRSVYDIKFS